MYHDCMIVILRDPREEPTEPDAMNLDGRVNSDGLETL